MSLLSAEGKNSAVLLSGREFAVQRKHKQAGVVGAMASHSRCARRISAAPGRNVRMLPEAVFAQ